MTSSDGVYEQEVRYDTTCRNTTNCPIVFDALPDDFPTDKPLYFYYKLTNFYQNHRRYVKSRSDEQLSGAASSDSTNSSCSPLGSWLDNSTGTPTNKFLYPCGLIANSVFNDTFRAEVTSSTLTLSLALDSSDIAWESDSRKFVSRAVATDETDVGPGGFILPKVNDPHFMVWMRTAGLPTFRKLYGVFKGHDFKPKDVIKIYANSTFPVESFQGQKWVVMSTTSWLGGKNSFLGYAYIIVGVICLLLGVVFFAKHMISPRALGDMKYFNWPALGKNSS